jgi:hypothetical protein
MATEVTFDNKEVNALLKKIGKNVKDIKDKNKTFTDILSSIVFEDVTRHFEDAPVGFGSGTFLGSGGITWPAWSARYQRRMARLGKGNNRQLNDTGKLKGGWQPVEQGKQVRTGSFGVQWYNPIKYARRHDEGGEGIPKRQFTWLSKGALDKMETQMVKFLEGEKVT